MGAVPVSFAEMACRQRQVGITRDGWEVQLLHRLSLGPACCFFCATVSYGNIKLF
ncbi:hypothetical protein GJA_3942 [Janthinobacterium agaricidamnosum NBRC 102515 = DSM 9628]|uniref:Uncharacterized protein n=1 Tax=Janthinobacterium agaricidamnosum NBRC 102515 = DSM 9628 TaxID=1349767 RepID=W0VB18_9BURK|nr:hypothetical protein GJA_3942 [Janthinobacterium agaricidamnosum NBRC 102515 = DSM 9628]